jgi:hypothetical protein
MLDVIVLQNKGEVPNMNDIIGTNEVLRNIHFDIPVAKSDVLRKPLRWRTRIKGDVQTIQLHGLVKSGGQVCEPDPI